ncbi:MAG: small multi-drug export protein [Atribacterota bacterium]
MNPSLLICILGFSPITEIRGSLLYWLAHPVIPFWQAFTLSFIFNLLPFFVVMFLFDGLVKFFIRYAWFERIWKKIVLNTRKKFEKYEKWEELGLAIFIGVPFPLTGVWTGSLICFLLGWSVKKSFPYVLLGLTIASVIVSAVVLSGKTLFSLF